MHCTNCGSPLPEGSAFCTNCGQPVVTAAAGVAGAAAGAPQSPYSSPAPSYQQNFYNQKEQAPQGQPMYQQPAAPRVFPQPATKRALAMCVYWGLLPLIFGFAVRDKSDEFITFHLNQALVCFLGAIISGFLAFVLIGGLLAIYILVMMIMGTVSAYNGEMKELPLIGKIKLVK